MSDAEEEERVTAHSYGAIDNGDADAECWMIRVPQKLAELFEKAPEGTDLGELVFTKGGSATAVKGKATKPSLTVHVSEALLDMHPDKKPSAMPLNYSLQAMTKKIPTMHPFTRNPNNGSVKLHGVVSRTANMQVEQDQNYRAMLKDRLVATNITSSRFVKPVEATESVMTKQRHQGPSKGFGQAVLQFGQRLLEAQQEAAVAEHDDGPDPKRARQFSPDQPIRSVIFELFGRQQYWTVKDLKSAAVGGGAISAGTKRGEAEIRDVLREIGDYHRSGDHKNMWELRKEFQKSG